MSEQHKLIEGIKFYIDGPSAGQSVPFRETGPENLDLESYVSNAEANNPDALYEVVKSRIITDEQREKMDDNDLLQ